MPSPWTILYIYFWYRLDNNSFDWRWVFIDRTFPQRQNRLLKYKSQQVVHAHTVQITLRYCSASIHHITVTMASEQSHLQQGTPFPLCYATCISHMCIQYSSPPCCTKGTRPWPLFNYNCWWGLKIEGCTVVQCDMSQLNVCPQFMLQDRVSVRDQD